MAKGIALVAALLLAGCSASADTPDAWKSQKYTVIEKSAAGAVAISEPHQDSKDVRSIYLLVYFATPDDDGGQVLVGKVELNCTFSQIRYGEATRLREDATVVGVRQPKHPEWTAINPQTGSGDLFTIVCGHVAQPDAQI